MPDYIGFIVTPKRHDGKAFFEKAAGGPNADSAYVYFDKDTALSFAKNFNEIYGGEWEVHPVDLWIKPAVSEEKA